MAAIIYHFYKTYNSDVLEHYYTLREASYFLLLYLQSLVMALGVGKPLIGLALIAFEIIWFIYNYSLYRYGNGTQISGYKKYFGISGVICLSYILLSLEDMVSWVAIVVIVSLSMAVLLTYCIYQIIGIYYNNLFNPKEMH